MLRRILEALGGDAEIDRLIRPPVVRFEGFDWRQAGKLRPTGAAALDRIVAERYSGDRS